MTKVNVRRIVDWDVVAIDRIPLRPHVLAGHMARCGVADDLTLTWTWVSPVRLWGFMVHGRRRGGAQ